MIEALVRQFMISFWLVAITWFLMNYTPINSWFASLFDILQLPVL